MAEEEKPLETWLSDFEKEVAELIRRGQTGAPGSVLGDFPPISPSGQPAQGESLLSEKPLPPAPPTATLSQRMSEGFEKWWHTEMGASPEVQIPEPAPQEQTQSALNAAEREIQGLQEELKALKDQSDVQKVRALVEHEERLAKENGELKEKLLRASTENEFLKDRQEKILKQVTDLRLRWSQTQEGLEAKTKKQEEEIGLLRDQIQSHRESKNFLEERYREAVQKRDQLDEEIKTLREERFALQNRFVDVQRGLAATQKAVEELKQENTRLSMAFESVKRESLGYQELIVRTQDLSGNERLQAARRGLAELSGQIKAQEERLGSLKSDMEKNLHATMEFFETKFRSLRESVERREGD